MPADVMSFVQSRAMRKAVYVLDGIYKVKLGRVHNLGEEEAIVAFEDMPGHVNIEYKKKTLTSIESTKAVNAMKDKEK